MITVCEHPSLHHRSSTRLLQGDDDGKNHSEAFGLFSRRSALASSRGFFEEKGPIRRQHSTLLTFILTNQHIQMEIKEVCVCVCWFSAFRWFFWKFIFFSSSSLSGERFLLMSGLLSRSRSSVQCDFSQYCLMGVFVSRPLTPVTSSRFMWTFDPVHFAITPEIEVVVVIYILKRRIYRTASCLSFR